MPEITFVDIRPFLEQTLETHGSELDPSVRTALEAVLADPATLQENSHLIAPLLSQPFATRIFGDQLPAAERFILGQTPSTVEEAPEDVPGTSSAMHDAVKEFEAAIALDSGVEKLVERVAQKFMEEGSFLGAKIFYEIIGDQIGVNAALKAHADQLIEAGDYRSAVIYYEQIEDNEIYVARLIEDLDPPPEPHSWQIHLAESIGEKSSSRGWGAHFMPPRETFSEPNERISFEQIVPFRYPYNVDSSGDYITNLAEIRLTMFETLKKMGWTPGETPTRDMMRAILRAENGNYPVISAEETVWGYYSLLLDGQKRLTALFTLVADDFLPWDTLHRIPVMTDTDIDLYEMLAQTFSEAEEVPDFSWVDVVGFNQASVTLVQRHYFIVTLSELLPVGADGIVFDDAREVRFSNHDTNSRLKERVAQYGDYLQATIERELGLERGHFGEEIRYGCSTGEMGRFQGVTIPIAPPHIYKSRGVYFEEDLVDDLAGDQRLYAIYPWLVSHETGHDFQQDFNTLRRDEALGRLDSDFYEERDIDLHLRELQVDAQAFRILSLIEFEIPDAPVPGKDEQSGLSTPIEVEIHDALVLNKDERIVLSTLTFNEVELERFRVYYETGQLQEMMGERDWSKRLFLKFARSMARLDATVERLPATSKDINRRVAAYRDEVHEFISQLPKFDDSKFSEVYEVFKSFFIEEIEEGVIPGTSDPYPALEGGAPEISPEDSARRDEIFSAHPRLDQSLKDVSLSAEQTAQLVLTLDRKTPDDQKPEAFAALAAAVEALNPRGEGSVAKGKRLMAAVKSENPVKALQELAGEDVSGTSENVTGTLTRALVPAAPNGIATMAVSRNSDPLDDQSGIGTSLIAELGTTPDQLAELTGTFFERGLISESQKELWDKALGGERYAPSAAEDYAFLTRAIVSFNQEDQVRYFLEQLQLSKRYSSALEETQKQFRDEPTRGDLITGMELLESVAKTLDWEENTTPIGQFLQRSYGTTYYTADNRPVCIMPHWKDPHILFLRQFIQSKDDPTKMTREDFTEMAAKIAQDHPQIRRISVWLDVTTAITGDPQGANFEQIPYMTVEIFKRSDGKQFLVSIDQQVEVKRVDVGTIQIVEIHDPFHAASTLLAQESTPFDAARALVVLQVGDEEDVAGTLEEVPGISDLVRGEVTVASSHPQVLDLPGLHAEILHAKEEGKRVVVEIGSGEEVSYLRAIAAENPNTVHFAIDPLINAGMDPSERLPTNLFLYSGRGVEALEGLRGLGAVDEILIIAPIGSETTDQRRGSSVDPSERTFRNSDIPLFYDVLADQGELRIFTAQYFWWRDFCTLVRQEFDQFHLYEYVRGVDFDFSDFLEAHGGQTQIRLGNENVELNFLDGNLAPTSRHFWNDPTNPHNRVYLIAGTKNEAGGLERLMAAVKSENPVEARQKLAGEDVSGTLTTYLTESSRSKADQMLARASFFNVD